MDLEIHAPEGKVKDWLIEQIMKELLDLNRQEKDFSRATVSFKDEDEDQPLKSCAVDLVIYGDNIFLKRYAANFELAVRDIIDDLRDKVNERMKKRNEPPEELVSTINV